MENTVTKRKKCYNKSTKKNPSSQTMYQRVTNFICSNCVQLSQKGQKLNILIKKPQKIRPKSDHKISIHWRPAKRDLICTAQKVKTNTTPTFPFDRRKTMPLKHNNNVTRKRLQHAYKIQRGDVTSNKQPWCNHNTKNLTNDIKTEKPRQPSFLSTKNG